MVTVILDHKFCGRYPWIACRNEAVRFHLHSSTPACFPFKFVWNYSSLVHSPSDACTDSSWIFIAHAPTSQMVCASLFSLSLFPPASYWRTITSINTYNLTHADSLPRASLTKLQIDSACYHSPTNRNRLSPIQRHFGPFIHIWLCYPSEQDYSCISTFLACRSLLCESFPNYISQVEAAGSQSCCRQQKLLQASEIADQFPIEARDRNWRRNGLLITPQICKLQSLTSWYKLAPSTLRFSVRD